MLPIHSSLSSILHAYQAKMAWLSLTSYQKKVTGVALLALSLLCTCYFLIQKYWFRAQVQKKIDPIDERILILSEGNKLTPAQWQDIPRLYPKLDTIGLCDSRDEDLQYLASIPSLRTLHLLYTDKMTDKDLEHFKGHG